MAIPKNADATAQISLVDTILEDMISDVEASGHFSSEGIADLRRLRDAGGLKKAVELLRLVQARPEVNQ